MDHICEGLTILDCGAHHDRMTVLFAFMTRSTGRVFAWGAIPDTAQTICWNAELDKCTNDVVYGHALGERQETVRYDHNFGNSNIAFGAAGAAATPVMEVVSLDSDVELGSESDFLKLDVEGSESAALKGAPLVPQQRPLIALEIHNSLFSDRVASTSRSTSMKYCPMFLAS